jgi:hypothetical protein
LSTGDAMKLGDPHWVMDVAKKWVVDIWIHWEGIPGELQTVSAPPSPLPPFLPKSGM